MSAHTIIWRKHVDVGNLYEAYVDGRMVGWIHARPGYCDRGHWKAMVDVPNLDHQDVFPRYFMRLETAVREMDEFLRWRLWKLPALQGTPEEQFAKAGVTLS